MELNWDWLRWLLTHFMTATGDVSIFYSDKDTCSAWQEQAGNSAKAADNATVCLSSDEEVQKSQEKPLETIWKSRKVASATWVLRASAQA